MSEITFPQSRFRWLEEKQTARDERAKSAAYIGITRWSNERLHIMDNTNKWETMKRDVEILVEQEDVQSKRRSDLKLHCRPLIPTLSEAELRDFESKHGVSLPSDYRDYLQFVGNGGGTFDLFRLGEMDENFGYMDWSESWIGDLAAPFPHIEVWNDAPAIVDEELPEDATDEELKAYDEAMELAEEIYWDTRHVNGAIPILHLGCSQRIWLVISGAERGNL